MKSGGEHWRIAAFHLYLQREYSNPTLQQTDAAAAVGITPAHLSRLLRQKTNRSFTWHRDTYRLRAAKRLLRETAKTLKEVAAEVGYASDAQLCRRFQERCGSTPLGYRTEVLHGRLQSGTIPRASEQGKVAVPSRSTSVSTGPPVHRLHRVERPSGEHAEAGLLRSTTSTHIKETQDLPGCATRLTHVK